MKDNTREALFNLVGGYLQDTIVFDLFAGTGAVGIEALSRGASHAFLVERHVPTTKLIRTNIESIGAENEVTIDGSDTFFWVRQFKKRLLNEIDIVVSDELSGGTPTAAAGSVSLIEHPWAVFCCPPYQLFEDRPDEIIDLLNTMLELCPDGSLFVVESDGRFDLKTLPSAHLWSTREYAPAFISVLKDVGHPHESELDETA